MIQKKEVQHIAKLARLGITPKEEKLFQKELSSILDYFKSLQKVDVSKIQPSFHPTEKFLEKKKNLMREDKGMAESRKVVEQLIEASPDKKERYIKVKAVL